MNLLKYKLNAYQYKVLSILITVVYAIPIVLSKHDFQDDIYRTNAGYVDWWFFNARPLAVYFYRAINQGYISPDIYPLTYILSFFCFYFLINYLVNKLVLNDDLLLKFSIFILFLCNPFFLECLSYKYDCITIVLSVCLGTIFVFKKQYKNVYLDFLSRSLILFIMFCVYQPALSFIIGLIALKLLVNNEERSVFNTFKDLFIITLNIFVVFIVYKRLIADSMLNDYYKSMSKTLILNHDFFKNIILNIKGYFLLIHLYLSKMYVRVPLIICLLLILLQINKKNYKKFIVGFICTPLLLLSFVSANIILQTPFFHPREMIGFSIPFVFLLLFIYKEGWVSKLIFILPLGFLLSSTFLSYSLYNYRNLMYERNKLIVSDLLISMYHFGESNIKKIAFTNETSDIMNGQTVILKSNPLIISFADTESLKSNWYSQAIINQQYNIHKEVISSDHFPEGKDVFSQCYIQSTFVDKVLYVKTGVFCQ